MKGFWYNYNGLIFMIKWRNIIPYRLHVTLKVETVGVKQSFNTSTVRFMGQISVMCVSVVWGREGEGGGREGERPCSKESRIKSQMTKRWGRVRWKRESARSGVRSVTGGVGADDTCRQLEFECSHSDWTFEFHTCTSPRSRAPNPSTRPSHLYSCA